MTKAGRPAVLDAAAGAGAEVDPLRRLDDYDFELPEALIADRPAPDRAASRLLVLDRGTGGIAASGGSHRVSALPSWLRRGDLLVVNATRVLSARLLGRKRSGGAAEALLLGREEARAAGEPYRALLKCTGRVREGLELEFGAQQPVRCTVEQLHGRGEVTLLFEAGADPYAEGLAPLPPYIQRKRAEAAAAAGRSGAAREDDALDQDRYQTVFAREPGAVAAPTAGLHLSEALLGELEAMGVERAEVILHVGAGTFRPLEREAFETGRLHEERFVLPPETAAAIAATRARGGRVIAVGTTTTRVLESCAAGGGLVEPASGKTELFIQPPEEEAPSPFRVVDGLITNFHLPRSSLLLLVAAFVGQRPLMAAYRAAIEQGYRFYSYGDAMLILDGAEAMAAAGRERDAATGLERHAASGRGRDAAKAKQPGSDEGTDDRTR